MRGPKINLTNVEIPALPFEKCLAKTWNNGVILCGRTVEDHCRIAGSIAKMLISIFNKLVFNFFTN